MDMMQVLVIATVALGVAILILAIGLLVSLRLQRRTVHQEARRAVEEERRRNALPLPNLPELRPRSPRKPRAEQQAKQAKAKAKQRGPAPHPPAAEPAGAAHVSRHR